MFVMLQHGERGTNRAEVEQSVKSTQRENEDDTSTTTLTSNGMLKLQILYLRYQTTGRCACEMLHL